MVKHSKYYLIMILIAIVVGVYQISLIDSFFAKYCFDFGLSDMLYYPKQIKQYVEDTKFALAAEIDSIDSSNNVAIKADSLSSNIPHSNPVIIDNGEVIPKIQKCTQDCTVLMIGDSVMGDVGFSLQRILKKTNPTWRVVDGHKVSSGLCNRDYYDWELTARKLVDVYKPNYVYVLVGTNDSQSIKVNGKSIGFGQEGWSSEYSQRVRNMIKIISNPGVQWGWVGLPLVREKGLNGHLQIIRDIQREVLDKNYIEVESIFGYEHKSQSFDAKLRAKDGTHLSFKGADLMAELVYNKIIGP